VPSAKNLSTSERSSTSHAASAAAVSASVGVAGSAATLTRSESAAAACMRHSETCALRKAICFPKRSSSLSSPAASLPSFTTSLAALLSRSRVREGLLLVLVEGGHVRGEVLAHLRVHGLVRDHRRGERVQLAARRERASPAALSSACRRWHSPSPQSGRPPGPRTRNTSFSLCWRPTSDGHTLLSDSRPRKWASCGSGNATREGTPVACCHDRTIVIAP